MEHDHDYDIREQALESFEAMGERGDAESVSVGPEGAHAEGRGAKWRNSSPRNDEGLDDVTRTAKTASNEPGVSEFYHLILSSYDFQSCFMLLMACGLRVEFTYVLYL